MAGKPSLASELFEQIRNGGAPFIRAMVNSDPPTFETEYLDFKGALTKGAPLHPNDVKKIWSEALAGFATTSGGVLVWGIDARKDQATGIDHASGLALVENPSTLRSRLQELLHQATDPPVVGVEILDLPEADGTGFVACLIPESDYKPHRAESAGKRWCMRIGDSFVDVPPSVLRSLFFPHRQSYAYLKIGRSGHRYGEAPKSLDFSIRLYNEGPATLDDPMIVVQKKDYLSVVPDPPWVFQDAVDGWRLRSPNPIHAGEFVVVGQISLRGDFNSLTGRFEFQLFARDQLPVAYTANVSADRDEVEEAMPRPLELSRFRSRYKKIDLGD